VWGVSIGDFWGMTPAEWWRIYEMKKPRDPENDFAGNLRHSDVEELYDLLD